MKLLTVAMMLFFSLIIGASAFATTPDFELQKQAEDISLALSENSAQGRAWGVDLIRVRTVLEVGIEIPLITKFSLNPEVEFHFVKN